ncbi:heat shock transcription factor, X-linked member 3-like [Mesocricetus auratus]|uniref:Heat shock transcription factor, X-linked member 3-like n=1 Tax=Mesocricetus auratus TaxID=10036 RepID=A0ABM2XCW5_MESAU|nr:heat shock transcription factor, X-linked member 3-like [Mesocricetus auratus]
MATWSVEEDCESNGNPTVDEEPESKDIPNSSSDSEAHSREGLVGKDDQDVIQDQTQPTASEEDNTNLLSLPFPRKLWAIVQNEAFKSVNWTEEGDTIMIDVDLFQREVLQLKGAKKIFETDSLKSFIRQLNLYGFRKISSETSVASSGENKKIMMYRNFNFQRDKPGLFQYIWGKEDIGSLANQATCVPVPLKSSQGPTSKKKKILPTRYSPRFYHKHEEESKKKTSSDKPPKENNDFVFSSIWAMKAIPGCYLQYQPSGESRNPPVEDTSHNTIYMPPTAPGVQDTEEVPSVSSSGRRILNSMMCLYNDSCSALLSALSQRQTNESPNEEEQEGSSDYKCVICEPIRNNPHL